MTRISRSGRLATLSALSLALVMGCSNSSGTPPVVTAPTITSFTPGAFVVAPGGATTLTAVFNDGQGGSATVNAGVGAVTSGTAEATGALDACTTFTLTVSNAMGQTTSQTSVATEGLYAFAGVPGGTGDVDGLGGRARFNAPYGATVDPATGNIYVADSQNDTIRQITPAGLVSTLAGVPGIDSPFDTQNGAAATFLNPQWLAADGSGHVYVADTGQSALRQITISTGAVTTLANPGSATLVGPMAGDGVGNVYAAFADGIHRYANGTPPASPISITGSVPAGFDFGNVTGLAVDAQGNLYLTATNTYQVFKLAVTVGSPDTWAFLPPWGTGQTGFADGAALATAQFATPLALAVAGSGNVYVVDGLCIREIQITNPASNAATVTTLAGEQSAYGYTDGTGSAVRFGGGYKNQAYVAAVDGLAVDPSGNLYVADTTNNAIRKMTVAAGLGTVTTFAGTPSVVGGGDGTAAAATFYAPTGVAVDGSGNVYVADEWNFAIRKITPAGMVSTLVSTSAMTGASGPVYGVAVDTAGNVYGSTYEDQSMIFKVEPDGAIQVLAAYLDEPRGLAVDAQGNIFWADYQDDNIYCLTPAGVLSTLAGTGSAGHVDTATPGDGLASFYGPLGVAVDPDDNVYVADADNSTIRKITFTWANGKPSLVNVTTLAGTASNSGSADGTGSAASFFYPEGVAVDGARNLYVTDSGNNTLRRITPAGVVSTVVGFAGSSSPSLPALYGNVPGALPASLNDPMGVGVDPTTGAVYITVQDSVMRLWILP